MYLLARIGDRVRRATVDTGRLIAALSCRLVVRVADPVRDGTAVLADLVAVLTRLANALGLRLRRLFLAEVAGEPPIETIAAQRSSPPFATSCS
jgi:hypothetical protein